MWNEKLKDYMKRLLDFLLPRSKTVAEIESLTSEELRKRVPRSKNNLPENILALFDYKNPIIRQAIWELKYRGNKKVVALLAECLYEELAEEIAERKVFDSFELPILIPIPLSKKRKLERGFNQTELLSDGLLKHASTSTFFEVNNHILLKIKDTESQTKKNRTERLKNLRDCFSVQDPAKIAGRNIILLDDVITTGATFEEARKTLETAGARKVVAIAVAH